GGGIYNDGDHGSAVATVVNSTFSTNSTMGDGAIFNLTQSGNATLTVLNSTFSGNTGAYSVGGILHYGAGGSVQIGSTILQAGASGANLGGGVTSLGYNLS